MSEAPDDRPLDTGLSDDRSGDAAAPAGELGVDLAIDLPPAVGEALADPQELAAALEAILFVVESPLTVATLAASLHRTTPDIDGALAALRAGYEQRGAGIELRDVAGGVRLYTHPRLADVVEYFLREGQRTKLSHAALETLAVIAYRQPVTRARVSAIRGVNVDGVVRTLLTRGLIVEVGADSETGGSLFRTTELFLERMGLNSLSELPSLAPLLPDMNAIDDIEGDG